MTREEAIKRLQYIRAEYEEPLALNSREDVRKAIGVYLESLDMAIEALRERPKGRWVRISDRPKTYIRRCSNCNRDSYTCFSEKDYDFCPWCGADMRDGEEE